MRLRGQGGDRGYAMAALLVGLAVMAILMSAALPAWRHQARREKEAELAFRGEQYVRAIQLYQAKMGPGMFPPSFDVLVQQKFLRKKYKDPMSPDGEFMARYAGLNPTPGQTGPGGSTQRGQTPPPMIGGQTPPPMIGGTPVGPGQSQGGGPMGRQSGPGGGQPGMMGGQIGPRGNQPGGIIGVYSKSRDTSIRVYRGATRYSEWQFVFAGIRNQPGGGGTVQPGERGRGGQPLPGAGGSPRPPGTPRGTGGFGAGGAGGRRGTPIVRPPGQ